MACSERNITTIEAWNPTPSSCLPGGIDVDVDLQNADGATLLDGEVTLTRDRINGGWVAYGDCADAWVSPELLAGLMRYCREAGEDLATMLRAIASRAVAQVTDEVAEAADEEGREFAEAQA